MKKGRLILVLIILALIIIQFFRPENNTSKADPVNGVATKYEVPMNVLMVLNDACYDCHSNYSTYPWYHKIQPVSWWMDHHINKAKKHVNFSEFATYDKEDAVHAFHEIKKAMKQHSMPIKGYKIMHKQAQLTDTQYKQVEDWASEMEAKLIAEK